MGGRFKSAQDGRFTCASYTEPPIEESDRLDGPAAMIVTLCGSSIEITHEVNARANSSEYTIHDCERYSSALDKTINPPV